MANAETFIQINAHGPCSYILVAHVRSLAEGDLPIARIILLILKVRIIFWDA